MENSVILFHVVVSLAIIGLILLQQGKGAEAGASFGGGASQTVFGSQGGGNFFAKVTGVLAVIFFATSFSLAIIAKNKASVVTIGADTPALVEQSAVQESEVPSIGVENADEASEVPLVPPEITAPDTSEEIPTVNQQ